MSRITRQANEARRSFPSNLFSGWRRKLSRGRPRNRDRSLNGLKTALVGLLIIAFLVGANAYLERVRRTAEAPVEILSIDMHPAPGKGAQGGVVVRYRFVVDNEIYEFVALRHWTLDVKIEAKVCYEPANPRNQSLVRPEDHCA